MNFTTLFIKRPVMTTLVMIGILVFGIVAYRQLPVSDLPNVDFPTVTVSATLPGTSPQTMAATVATPLEKQFSTIAGIDNMTSTSSLGQTQIVIQFALDRNIDAAAQDVQAAIAQTMPQPAAGHHPAVVSEDESGRRADPDAGAHVERGAALARSTSSARRRSRSGCRWSAAWRRCSCTARRSTPCASSSIPASSRRAASRSRTSRTRSRSRTSTCRRACCTGRGRRSRCRRPASSRTRTQFGDVIVAYRNGAPVHLEEIGRITDDVQNNKTASWYNGARSIVLAIQRQPGTNTVDVANRVKAALEQDRSRDSAVGAGVDRSTTGRRRSRRRCDDVTFTLELTLVLVVLVIFLFLRNLSATIIPSLALPMSIIGTFSVMYLLHYSLDNLSLMALTLAVGFVVDDAIVMLENIVRHLEMGKPKMQAAIDGAAEVGFTILSMTFSLAAVFIPFLFMGGIIGKLFHEFAVTIGVAILVSGFVSLTLTPMLSSRFLKSDHGKQHGRLYQATETLLRRVARRCTSGRSRWVMARRPLTLVFSVVILVATAYLFWSTPKGLFPTDDTGPAARDDRSGRRRVVRRARRAPAGSRGSRSRKDPDVRSVTSSVGTTAAANQGQLTIDLKPIDERKRSADADRARPHEGGRRRVRTSRCSSRIRRRSRSAASRRRASISTRCRAATSTALNTRGARRSRARMRAAAGADRRHERPADRESAGHGRHRSRAGGPARRVGERDREHAVRRVRPAAGVDDLHVDERVLGRDGAAARVPAGRRRARQALGAVDARTARAAQHRGEVPLHASAR